MSRRFRPTDAFVDESIRGQRYLMACVLVQAQDMQATRADIGSLAGPKSSRVHFNAELDSRRQSLLMTFAAAPIESFVVVCRRSHGVSEFEARSRCLAFIVQALQQRSVDRLVIESRQDDVDDERTIRRHRQREPRLVFEHRQGIDEPLLWIADGVAWSVGAGPRWSYLLGSRLSRIAEV
ncbi:MAG: hypothetical protein WCC60_22850 [Ilumatobacteraceae bacterium]